LLADLLGTVLIATALLYRLGTVIAQSKLLSFGVQLAGAGYVIIFGLTCLWRRCVQPPADEDRCHARGRWLESFLAGLLTPKTLIFFSLLLQSLLDGADALWEATLFFPSAMPP
jgi:threonine/homoserine/homoserine lactone efflux protein